MVTRRASRDLVVLGTSTRSRIAAAGLAGICALTTLKIVVPVERVSGIIAGVLVLAIAAWLSGALFSGKFSVTVAQVTYRVDGLLSRPLQVGRPEIVSVELLARAPRSFLQSHEVSIEILLRDGSKLLLGPFVTRKQNLANIRQVVGALNEIPNSSSGAER